MSRTKHHRDRRVAGDRYDDVCSITWRIAREDRRDEGGPELGYATAYWEFVDAYREGAVRGALGHLDYTRRAVTEGALEQAARTPLRSRWRYWWRKMCREMVAGIADDGDRFASVAAPSWSMHEKVNHYLSLLKSKGTNTFDVVITSEQAERVWKFINLRDHDVVRTSSGRKTCEFDEDEAAA